MGPFTMSGSNASNLHGKSPDRRKLIAVVYADSAVALNPGEAESHAWLANVLSYVGRSAEALDQLAHAIRLDPLYPPLWDFYLGRALLHLGRYDEAADRLATCERRGLTVGRHWRRYLAAALAHLGRLDEAQAALTEAAALQGYGSIREIYRSDSYVESVELDRLVEGLRKAGVPE